MSIDMTNEVWRPVVGFDGRFEVSNFGRVKSLARVSIHTNQFGVRCDQAVAEKILTQTSNGKYPTVCLSVQGKCRAHAVHRLVLEAFVGPCPAGMLCRHFPDRDPYNNRLDNLQWGTPQENAADMRVHGTAFGRVKHTAEHRAKMSRLMTEIWKQRRQSVGA